MILSRGFQYWAALKGDAEMPHHEQFDAAGIPMLLPHLIFLEVRHDPLDFRYRVIGSRVREHLISDYTGLWMSEIEHQRPPSMLYDNLSVPVLERRPHNARTPYVGPKREFRTSLEVILPFRDDDGAVSRLLSFLDFVPRL